MVYTYWERASAELVKFGHWYKTFCRTRGHRSGRRYYNLFIVLIIPFRVEYERDGVRITFHSSCTANQEAKLERRK